MHRAACVRPKSTPTRKGWTGCRRPAPTGGCGAAYTSKRSRSALPGTRQALEQGVERRGDLPDVGVAGVGWQRAPVFLGFLATGEVGSATLVSVASAVVPAGGKVEVDAPEPVVPAADDVAPVDRGGPWRKRGATRELPPSMASCAMAGAHTRAETTQCQRFTTLARASREAARAPAMAGRAERDAAWAAYRPDAPEAVSRRCSGRSGSHAAGRAPSSLAGLQLPGALPASRSTRLGGILHVSEERCSLDSACGGVVRGREGSQGVVSLSGGS